MKCSFFPLFLLQILQAYLTVALILGASVPKESKLAITAEMNVIAQKKPKRLPLKFQDETFGKIKIFRKFFLGGRYTGSGPEMKTNSRVDNHFLTLSTRWSYHFDDDMLPRCAFEAFGTGVPKISASVIRKIFSATVKVDDWGYE